MPIIFQKKIHRQDLKRNPYILYLFGDNDDRKGSGGQAAEMRGEPNAAGIRVKKHPSNNDDSYWTDNDYNENCEKIRQDLQRIIRHLKNYGTIIIPLDGIGTGRAKLEVKAPKTFKYLQRCLEF